MCDKMSSLLLLLDYLHIGTMLVCVGSGKCELGRFNVDIIQLSCTSWPSCSIMMYSTVHIHMVHMEKHITIVL
jgi:hypothetical protein